MDAKRFGTAACTALLKLLLMIFNVLFFCIGLVFLVVGIYGTRSFKEIFSFTQSSYIYVPIICIGLFMCIVGVLALWCTPKGVTWLLYLYSVVVFVLFLSVFTISILFVVKRDAFENTIHDGISNAMKNYPSVTTIDLAQENLRCCGLNNYTDWFQSKWAAGSNNVPESCCLPNLPHICGHLNLTPLNSTDLFQDGCYKKMKAIIEDKYLIIAGIGFGASFVILLGSLLTCTLSHNLKKNRYEQVE